MISKTDSLSLYISRSIAASVASPRRPDLHGQLEELAKVLASLPGILGAIVVAVDEEGAPLTAGAFSLSFSTERSPLEILYDLHEQLAPQMQKAVWLPVSLSLAQASGPEEDASQLLVLPIRSASRILGLALVAASASPRSKLSLRSIAESGEVLAAAIQSSLHAEAWNRIEILQHLAWSTFASSDWNLAGLVGQLATLFEADAVTILLKEQDELRLAASTDLELGRDKPVVYKAGQGFTGYVFATGQALRLSNTRDYEGIKRSTGLERREPTFPERAATGSTTGQFLGVAMRFGGRVVGVLRMSRRRGIARFTHEDERALQFFADLLGAAFAPTWDILLVKGVLESITESIVVSRRELTAEGAYVNRIVLANPGAEKLFGKSREEIENLTVKDIYDADEYQEIRLKLRGSLEEAKRKGYSTFGPITARLKGKGNAMIPVVISYRLVSNDFVSPPILYTIGLARDVSESEKAAEQYHRLLELLGAMKIAYFSADRDGLTKISTPMDSELTGYSQAELAAVSRDHLYFDPRERDRLLKRIRAHKGQILHQGLERLRRKDGSTFWAEGDYRILKGSQDDEIGLEGLYRDVTDRIRLQGFLNAETRRVLGEDEIFSRLKRDAEFHLDYMSSLGHQLQTPLGSLVETLRNSESGLLSHDDLAGRLPYVIGQAIVCTRLVRDLSFMDKILRGEPFRRERVSLARLAIETKIDFTHLLKEKRIELDVDDESLDRFLRVSGHREMLRQVVVNLVDNAIKYSLSGTIINIRGRKWREEEAFEITNQGLPIPEAMREKIFERGFRTDRAQAVVPHGTGLGLWLVRKIVEAHGASICCQEVIEVGQKRILFRILFPRMVGGFRRMS